MDWPTATATVHDRWMAAGRLTLPPDDPSGDDDLAFWDEVEALVNGNGALQEGYIESQHIRNRLGRWINMLGDRLEYREHHHAEASNEGAKIVVGRKFLDLPEHNQAFVIAHELGHDLDDALLSDPKTQWVYKDESWADAHGVPLGGPQQTPGERIADAYGVALTGDMESAKRWPAILHVAAEAQAHGMPLHPGIAALLADRPAIPTAPVSVPRRIGGRPVGVAGAFTADDAAALPADKLDAYRAILEHSGLRWSKDAVVHRDGGVLVVGSAFLDASPQQRRDMTAAVELQEADIYTEALHPRDRLGRWLHKQFGEVLAKPASKKGGKATAYRAARWVDTGQDLETMTHEAVRLLHPAASHEEHHAIVQAVLADKPPPKHVSKEAKAATKTLRKKSTPEGLWGKYLYRLHGVAADAHRDDFDKVGIPYIKHVEAVADSVSDEAKPVALFHDALEDTGLTPEVLKAALTEKSVVTPEQAQEMTDAVKLLTHDPAVPYDVYIEAIKTAKGRAGELAREVKRADIQHNLGRITADSPEKVQRLKPRYKDALDELAVKREPIAQRGKAVNIGRIIGPKQREKLNRALVKRRLNKLYDASVASGDAVVEEHWYQTAHDQIAVLAKDNNIDPYTLAAIVAATSPQMTWYHEYKDGSSRLPNLDLAVHTVVGLARKYPDEPAPKLVDRLIEESAKREKGTPSELGGLGESVLKAIRIYRGEDPERVLGAPKTRSFMNNLAFPDRATTATLDEHMGRAALGIGKENYSKSTEGILDEQVGGSGYTWLADIVKEIANDRGVLPHAAQAIIWVSQKKIAEQIEADKKAAEKAAQT